MTIFQDYYAEAQLFEDLFTSEPENGVDVIIPIIHTNEIWQKNLLSFYREIPIKRLLIGDGGCIDNSIEIVKKFPRVEIFDHRNFTSLGFSICKLIECVDTDWFVYLHSDVYLPPGWFKDMVQYQSKYDWFECRQRITALIEYDLGYENINRALSGSQMGRRQSFNKVLPKIEDDFLYRNEDIILAELITESGYKYGRADDIFHYHQVMYKPSKWLRKVKDISIELILGRDEEVRTYMMQVKGLIKYLSPSPRLLTEAVMCMDKLQTMGELNWSELIEWSKTTNPKWTPFLVKESKKLSQRLVGRMITKKAKNLYLLFKNKLGWI